MVQRVFSEELWHWAYVGAELAARPVVLDLAFVGLLVVFAVGVRRLRTEGFGLPASARRPRQRSLRV
jgi:hypothetical protein